MISETDSDIEWVCNVCNDECINVCGTCDTITCANCGDEEIWEMTGCEWCELCIRGFYCDGGVMETSYCSAECLPKDLVSRIEESRNEETRMEDETEPRRQFLIKKLKQMGLGPENEYRRLCRAYISGSNMWSVQDIVRRTAELKYLFDYCDLKLEKYKMAREVVSQVQNYVETAAENSILERIGGFPCQWPWLVDRHLAEHKERFAQCLEAIRLIPGGSEYEIIKSHFASLSELV
jgi:hypothetical protein